MFWENPLDVSLPRCPSGTPPTSFLLTESWTCEGDPTPIYPHLLLWLVNIILANLWLYNLVSGCEFNSLSVYFFYSWLIISKECLRLRTFLVDSYGMDWEWTGNGSGMIIQNSYNFFVWSFLVHFLRILRTLQK